MAGSRRQRILAILGLFAVAIPVWAIGVIGVGRAGEDICLTHPPAEATGYQSEGSVWPPRMTCVYGTNDGGTLVVDHWVYATAAAVWLFGLPVVAAFGAGMIARTKERG